MKLVKSNVAEARLLGLQSTQALVAECIRDMDVLARLSALALAPAAGDPHPDLAAGAFRIIQTIAGRMADDISFDVTPAKAGAAVALDR